MGKSCGKHKFLSLRGKCIFRTPYGSCFLDGSRPEVRTFEWGTIYVLPKGASELPEVKKFQQLTLFTLSSSGGGIPPTMNPYAAVSNKVRSTLLKLLDVVCFDIF